MYQQYKNRGVEFVSMSVDDREDKDAVVQGIPDVMLYDRTGRLRYDLNGNDPNHQASLKDVENGRVTLVAEK